MLFIQITGRIRLYCKGADTVIFERLSGGQDAIRASTLEHLEVYFMKCPKKKVHVGHLRHSHALIGVCLRWAANFVPCL